MLHYVFVYAYIFMYVCMRVIYSICEEGKQLYILACLYVCMYRNHNEHLHSIRIRVDVFMYVCIYVHAAFQVNDKVWVGGSSLKSPLGADSYAINFLFGCQTTETGRHAFTFTQTHIDANTYIHYHTYMHTYILCIIHTNSTCIIQCIYTHTYIHTVPTYMTIIMK
jgi:hypothetical protein